MIYMEPHMLGWLPLFQSWIATLPPHFNDQHTLIAQLYNRIVPPCLDFVRKAGFKVCSLGIGIGYVLRKRGETKHI